MFPGLSYLFILGMKVLEGNTDFHLNAKTND